MCVMGCAIVERVIVERAIVERVMGCVIVERTIVERAIVGIMEGTSLEGERRVYAVGFGCGVVADEKGYTCEELAEEDR